ncbi:MAG: GNAT family N-acetyltransferase [Desulfobacterales bacterium]|nr:GNAT family N-acetyltransferase [Desulfobacterales bacterium]
MDNNYLNWEKFVVSPSEVIEKIEPGMTIFIGTGAGEPRTLMEHLMKYDASNLQDLELVQLVSFGDAISFNSLKNQKYRLKTFFPGWVASEAITEGLVDLIPSRFGRIPRLLESKQIPIDVAFIQITPPNESGYCSLGVAVDVARQAIEQATLVVGEINTHIPRTLGDTFVHISDFHFLVKSTKFPIYFDCFEVNDIIDKVARNVASVIEDGSCLAFSVGPMFEALSNHLSHKRHLGIHSPIFTDALMRLIKTGAVTNRKKDIYRGRSISSYALGTPELMRWLNDNPLVEFQGIDKVINPIQIGRNHNFVAIIHGRKVDLTGRITLQVGKGRINTEPSEIIDVFNGSELSSGGYSVIALSSRNTRGESNIRISIDDFPNHFSFRESIDLVVTEYGVANLKGRSIRERAQALIDISHPEDRKNLVEQAKEKKILYQDQIFIADSSNLYPDDVATKHIFKGGLEVRFRAIRPSDEEKMRRLFYRFSDKAVYYRYFTPIKTMPHSRMQEYVNIDYRKIMSIVGVIGELGHGEIIAEARYSKDNRRPYGDVAFVVDEKYQGVGIATFLYTMLIRLAKERGIQGFTADVLASNREMLRVFEKGGIPIKANLEYGVYELSIPFDTEAPISTNVLH